MQLNNNDDEDAGENEDGGIRAGGKIHENDKRENQVREREEEEEGRQEIVRLATRDMNRCK